MARLRLDTDAFTDRAYEMLPKLYRDLDEKTGYQLKRFMKSIADSAVSSMIEESNGILDLNDPDRTPSNVLPVLFKQYGMDIFYGLPEYYIRKLLPLMGDIYARKGSTSALEYLASVLSEVTAEVVVSDDFEHDRHIDLVLEMDYDGGEHGIPDRDQMAKLVENFVPFFINTTVIYLYSFYDSIRLRVYEWYKDRVRETTGEYCEIIPAYETDYKFFRSGLFGESLVFGDKNVWLLDVDYTKDHIKDVREDVSVLSASEEDLGFTVTDFKEESPVLSSSEKLLDIVVHKEENDSVGFLTVSPEEARFFNGLLFNDTMQFGYDERWLADQWWDTFIYHDSDNLAIRTVLENTPFFRNGVFNDSLMFGSYSSEADEYRDTITQLDGGSISVAEQDIVVVSVSALNEGADIKVTDALKDKVSETVFTDSAVQQSAELFDSVVMLFTGVPFSVFGTFVFGVPDVVDKISYRNGVRTVGYPTPYGYVCADL